MRLDYAPYSYDDYLCLKPPFLLWLSMAYLSRAIVLPFVAGLSKFAGVSSDAFSSLHGALSLETFAPSAVAVLVLYAACRRAPNASSATRWIWARGRFLLAVSACLDLLLSMTPAIRHRGIDDLTFALVLASVGDAYILLYILFARRVRDTFAAFPSPTEAA